MRAYRPAEDRSIPAAVARVRPVACALPPALLEERLRVAEALFQQIAPVLVHVDFALANYREPERQKTTCRG